MQNRIKGTGQLPEHIQVWFECETFPQACVSEHRTVLVTQLQEVVEPLRHTAPMVGHQTQAFESCIYFCLYISLSAHGLTHEVRSAACF